MAKKMAKKVAIVIAHNGYQQVEYAITKEIIQEAGFQVVTISNKKGTAIAHDKSSASVDADIAHSDPLQFEAVILIGGPGALEALDTDASYRFIQQAVMAEKVVAAICIATRILAKAGALVSKTATGWDGDNKLKAIYDQHGVIYDNTTGVVTDGRVVTAQGPTYAAEFAYDIVKLI